MRTFPCTCGNVLYFDSSLCLQCGRDTGMCPHCRCVTAFILEKPDGIHCSRDECGGAIFRCSNFHENGCNRCVSAGDAETSTLCDYCQTTRVIPDLTIEGNREKWARLERAKRRVLDILDVIGLPFRSSPIAGTEGVSFEFKADDQFPVHTGHENGCIVINLREADDVEREKTRVAFQEPQRTLIGHFRHELGHYFWDRLVNDEHIEAFRDLFGDERSPEYTEAMARYYASGASPNWQDNYISAYATMHPWEDFAETFGAYLDMVTILDTARSFGLTHTETDDVDSMIVAFQQIGIAANELNRDMGLIDLVPKIFVPPVIEKMRFIHSLAQSSRTPSSR